MFNLVPFLVRQKVYFDQALMYSRYVTVPSLLILAMRGIGVPVTPKWALVGVPLLLLCMILFGWFMVNKAKAYGAEASRHASLNPFYKGLEKSLLDIKANTASIEQKVDYWGTHIFDLKVWNGITRTNMKEIAERSRSMESAIASLGVQLAIHSGDYSEIEDNFKGATMTHFKELHAQINTLNDRLTKIIRNK